MGEIYVGKAGLIDLALLVAMLLWQPSLDTLPVLFVIVGFWGLAEAILFTQLISLFAVVFKDKKEAAFSGLKMFQSLGACLNFATAKYMCTRTKIYIVGGLLVWAMLGVTLLEIITNRKERREKEAEAVCDDSLPSKSPLPADSSGTQNVPNGSAPATKKKPLGPTPV